MPWGAPWGSPENMIEYQFVDISADATYGDFTFRPVTNCGDQFFSIYISARHQKTVWAPEGVDTKVRFSVPWGARSLSYAALAQGDLSDAGFRMLPVIRYIEAEDDANKTVTLEYELVPEPMDDIGDTNGYLSSWSLSGIKKLAHTLPVNNFPARGRIKAALSVAGGTATVTLKAGNVTIASGSGAVGTTVTLTASNSSGVSGSVAVDAGAGTDSDIDVYVRWPKEVIIYRDTSDPPSTEVARVQFEGSNVVRYTETADLTADEYFYRIQPNSDTDDLGTISATQAVTLGALPGSPSNLAYVSGSVVDCVLGFSGSSTASATYRLYGQDQPGEIMSMNDPDSTAGAVSPLTEQTISYPNISGFSGFSGTVYAMVRAVHPTSGLEDRNTDMIALEFDQFGTFIQPRPNKAMLVASSVDVTSGLTLGVRCTYDGTDEKGTATQVKLFQRTETGTYDYNNAVDTQTLTTGADGVKKATFSYAFASAGFYYVTALAATAGGVTSVQDSGNELLVWVSDADIPAVTGFSAFASRS